MARNVKMSVRKTANPTIGVTKFLVPGIIVLPYKKLVSRETYVHTYNRAQNYTYG